MITAKLNRLAKWGFGQTARLWLYKNFGGIHLDRESAFGGELPWPGSEAGPVFFVATHASWFDPLVAAELAINQQKLRVLAPMAASEVRRYRSLKHVGVFGVESGEGPQVAAFIEREILTHPQTCFWVTPQGSFAPNEKPQPVFKTGISRWSNQLGRRRVPVVVHYYQGIAPRPLVFVRYGEEVPPSILPLAEDAELLRQALEKETQALLKRVYASQSGARSDLSGFVKIL